MKSLTGYFNQVACNHFSKASSFPGRFEYWKIINKYKELLCVQNVKLPSSTTGKSAAKLLLSALHFPHYDKNKAVPSRPALDECLVCAISTENSTLSCTEQSQQIWHMEKALFSRTRGILCDRKATVSSTAHQSQCYVVLQHCSHNCKCPQHVASSKHMGEIDQQRHLWHTKSNPSPLSCS